MTMPKGKSNLTDRDFIILKFLWRFKVATTQVLSYKFFPESQMAWAYQRLRALEKSRYIKCIPDARGKHYVWTLDVNGFLALRELWPMLREKGFGTEYPIHDIVVAAAHLGEFLAKLPDEMDLFTEQELRRYERSFYPDWVPNTEDHRPDGYWRVGSKTVALEVELHPKAKGKYKGVAEFYLDYPQIKSVLWIVARIALLKTINSALAEAIGNGPNIHNIVWFDHFLKEKWQSKILVGPSKGLTMAQFLNVPQINPDSMVRTGLFLDTRKAPMKSPTPATPDFREFIY